MKETRRGKKQISIRRHLPLSVRVHYDLAKNLLPSKLLGVGIIMLIAVFGIILAIQAGGSSGSANNYASEYTEVTDFNQVDYSNGYDQAIFTVSVKNQATLSRVKYHTSINANIPSCYPGPSNYRRAASMTQHRFAGTAGAATARARFNTQQKSVCIMIVFKKPGSQTELHGFHGPYDVNDNIVVGRLSPTVNVGDSGATRGEAVFEVEARHQRTIRLVKYNLSSNSDLDACKTTANSYNKTADRLLSGDFRYKIDFNSTVRNICVMVVYRHPGSSKDQNSFHGPQKVNQTARAVPANDNVPFDLISLLDYITAPRVVVSQTGNVFLASAVEETVRHNTWAWKIRNQGDCNRQTFVIGAAGNLHGGEGKTFNIRDDQIPTYAGKYICFRVQNLSGNWGYGSRIIFFELSPNEVQADAKWLGAWVAYQITNYDPESSMIELAAIVTDDSARADALAMEAAIVHHPGMWSRGTIEYAQLGGHLNDRISIMVVVRQELGREDTADTERAETRTMDVRLVRGTSGAWEFEELASAGGQPVARPADLSPLAAAVVDNPRINLPDTAIWDIYSGYTDHALHEVMLDIAERTPYSVIVLQTGHPHNVFGTNRLSNHTVGRAVDIHEVNSELVIDSHDTTSSIYELSEWLVSRRDIREFGSPWRFDGAVAHNFTNEVHHDHLHVGVFP